MLFFKCRQAWCCIFCKQISESRSVLKSQVCAGYSSSNAAFSSFHSSSKVSREGHQISPSPLMQTSSKGSWLQSLKIKTGKHPQSTWFCSVPCIVCVCFLTSFTTSFCKMGLHRHLPPAKKHRSQKGPENMRKALKSVATLCFDECTVQWCDVIIDTLLFAAAVC